MTFAPIPIAHRAALAVALMLAPTIPSNLLAADLPSPLVASFTKTVQPLLLNKCATGACHGGPTAHAPKFCRGDVANRIDRKDTLDNISIFIQAVGTTNEPASLLALISARHPASASLHARTASPLSPQERLILETWLKAALDHNPFAQRHAVVQASASETLIPSLPTPNRFRAMLDAAANPLPLPLPREPQGLILGKPAAIDDD